MKTKLTAVVLLIAVLMGAFSFAISAATVMPTLQSYIDNVNIPGQPYKNVVVYLTNDVSVPQTTVIPQNITFVIGTGYRMYVNATLYVSGSITAADNQIVIGAGGSVVNLGTGGVGTTCSFHKTAYTTCTMCTQTYCPSCAGGYHAKDTSTGKCFIFKTDNSVCGIHGYTKSYCANCNVYYCPTCIGGTHLYNPATKTCGILTGGGNALKCPTHTTTSLSYCDYCKAYYCSVCSNGYHIYNSTTGKCTLSSTPAYYCGIHNTVKTYCNDCKTYYCPTCSGGYHVYNSITGKCSLSSTTAYYCALHNTVKTYCNDCKTYYCTSCAGGYHYYNAATKSCYIYNGGINTPGIPYWYYQYVWIPGFGYLAMTINAEKPIANIPSGSIVESGTQVELYTATPGAEIYYTLDGTAPTVKGMRYNGPITIKSNVTINAVAFHPYLYTSGIGVFTYTIKKEPVNTFTDINSYPGLNSILNTLVTAKVIASGKTFDPSGKVSWSDLKSWFTAAGLDVSKASVSDKDAAKSSELTYEELIYLSYKIMRANSVIRIAKGQGSDLIDKLTNKSEITDTAKYKAAYASMIENNTLYGLNFKPQAAANRAYLAAIIAWVINN